MPSPNTTALAETADYLAELRLQGRRVEALPQRLMPVDLAAGYAAQRLLVQRLTEAWGGRPAGYKIALTNPAAQQMLGVPHPVFGTLLSARVHASGVRLAAADYVVRIIECEVGFEMASDVPARAEPYDADSIAAFVAAAMPAIELVEHHFAAIDRVTPESLAADNAVHGAWIHGHKHADWRALDLAAQATRLEVNGQLELEGHSSKVLGHPLNALAWLANALPEQGLALRAGDFVTTGITTDAIYSAAAGDELVATLGALGEVRLAFV